MNNDVRIKVIKVLSSWNMLKTFEIEVENGLHFSKYNMMINDIVMLKDI